MTTYEVKHSVELQAFALRAGNFLISHLWPIGNRATMTPSPVILLCSSAVPDVSHCFWVLPSCEPHKEINSSAFLPLDRSPRFQKSRMLYCRQSLPEVFAYCKHFLLSFGKFVKNSSTVHPVFLSQYGLRSLVIIYSKSRIISSLIALCVKHKLEI